MHTEKTGKQHKMPSFPNSPKKQHTSAVLYRRSLQAMTNYDSKTLFPHTAATTRKKGWEYCKALPNVCGMKIHKYLSIILCTYRGAGHLSSSTDRPGLHPHPRGCREHLVAQGTEMARDSVSVRVREMARCTDTGASKPRGSGDGSVAVGKRPSKRSHWGLTGQVMKRHMVEQHGTC